MADDETSTYAARQRRLSLKRRQRQPQIRAALQRMQDRGVLPVPTVGSPSQLRYHHPLDHKAVALAESTLAEQLASQPKISKGECALLTLKIYHLHGLPPPRAAVRDVVACYRSFKESMPPSGWVNDTASGEAPLTLGQAFGVPDAIKHVPSDGREANGRTRRLEAFAPKQLETMFRPLGELSRINEDKRKRELEERRAEAEFDRSNTQGRRSKPIPTDEDVKPGYVEAARRLGGALTPAEVEKYLPKTRKNRRRSQTDTLAPEVLKDPYGGAPREAAQDDE